MEISTFVRYRPTWRGIALMIALAFLGAAIAGYLTYRKPPTYTVQSTVFLRQILPGGTPDYLLGPIADDYELALGLPAVTRAASRASNLSEAAIGAGLTSERVGSSANIHVLLSSTQTKTAVTAVRAASRQALIELADQNLSHAQREANVAQTAYETAAQALKVYESAHGNDGTAQHTQLTADVDRTLTTRADRLSTVEDGQFELQSAQTAKVITVGDPSQDSRVTPTLRAGVTAGLIAGMLGLVVIVLVDRRRLPKIHWAPPSETSADAFRFGDVQAHNGYQRVA